METQPSHPFFVYGKGWASFSPDEALHDHGLKCHLLEVGDVCISLTPRDQSKQLPSSETIGTPQNLSRKQMPQTISTTATGTTVTSRQIPSYEPSLQRHHQHQHQHQLHHQQMMSQRHLSDSIYGMHVGRPPISDNRKFSTAMAPPPPPPSSLSSSSSSSSSSSASSAENVAMAAYDGGEAIDATMHSRKRRTWSICENICDDPKKNKPN